MAKKIRKKQVALSGVVTLTNVQNDGASVTIPLDEEDYYYISFNASANDVNVIFINIQPGERKYIFLENIACKQVNLLAETMTKTFANHTLFSQNESWILTVSGIDSGLITVEAEEVVML